MTSKSKVKGNRFERYLVDTAKELGLSAVRAWGSNGKSLGVAEDVDCIINGIAVQAKSRKKLPDYLQIPDSCAIVAIKQDYNEPMVLMKYMDWLKLIGEKK